MPIKPSKLDSVAVEISRLNNPKENIPYYE